ncbi:hypothetical protein L6452_02228 [Arctium lappa]|uniref:Uncharacterized protein n=1 Tax=Arctium lappa TaxID=4217 RepID=A0ACB9FIV6_ARCLA|nr:hypothetical protein L6452_02228 [Arctium lappa]
MIRLPGGRKRSERLMKKNSFSNYMNTTENPLDEDGNEIKYKSAGRTSNKPPVVKPHIEVNKQYSREVVEVVVVVAVKEAMDMSLIPCFSIELSLENDPNVKQIS